MNIFVDTCVWRDWLTFKNKLPFSDDFNRDNADTFNEIYKIVASQSEEVKYLLIYNTLIEAELTTRFLNELPFCFENIKGMRFMKKASIPLTRTDNIYKLDGSLLYGGRRGGTLRKALQTNDQYDHEAEIKNSIHPLLLQVLL